MASYPVSVDMNRRSASNVNYQFPKDIGAHGILFVFKKYEYQQTRGLLSTVSNIGTSVLFPLPKQLNDRTGVRINRPELGMAGEIAATAMSANHGELKAIQKAVADMFPKGDAAYEGIKNFLTGGEGTIQETSQTGYLIRRALGSVGGPLAQGVDIGAGTTLNPKQSLAFDGVEMKSHSFDWDFAPTSVEESESLRKIIRTIKNKMLPEYAPLTIGGQNALQRIFLKYPHLVDVYLIGVDNKHFFKYKTGMLQSLDINYAPTGSVGVLRGGKPAMMSVQMSIYEADIHTATDYEETEERR